MTVGCTSGSVRLTDSGILQICKNNEWRTVCSTDWGNLDTAVACRQLGYDGILCNYNLSCGYQCHCVHFFVMQEAILKTHDPSHQQQYQWTLLDITAMGKRTICETVKMPLLPVALEGLPLYVCEEMFQVTELHF